MRITNKDIQHLFEVMPDVTLTANNFGPVDCNGGCKGGCENTATND